MLRFLLNYNAKISMRVQQCVCFARLLSINCLNSVLAVGSSDDYNFTPTVSLYVIDKRNVVRLCPQAISTH